MWGPFIISTGSTSPGFVLIQYILLANVWGHFVALMLFYKEHKHTQCPAATNTHQDLPLFLKEAEW